jgi:hypothetical protein
MSFTASQVMQTSRIGSPVSRRIGQGNGYEKTAHIYFLFRKGKDRDYFYCRFSRRKENHCSATLRINRLLHLGEILIEQAGEHEHQDENIRLKTKQKKVIREKIEAHFKPGQIQDILIVIFLALFISIYT